MYSNWLCNQIKYSPNLKIFNKFISQHKFLSKTNAVRFHCRQGLNKHSSIRFTDNIFLKNVAFSKLETAPSVCKRYFHTTPPKKALPPVIWVVLRSVLKFAAVITGRSLRKWWASLPKNKKNYFLNKIRENQRNLMVGAALLGGAVYVYYQVHLMEDPITKRKKFLLFSEKQIMQMAKIECDVVLENYRNSIITSGYHYNHVLRVANRILQANKHLPGTNRAWKVFIVDDIDTRNAFVLPSGHIFIFTGMLAAVSNDDQLAAILAHEMAHALLCHAAEVASKTHLLELLLLIPFLALWTLLPDSIALSSHYLTEYISSILFQLPMSRKLETEADTVGLEMTSRACYDPREASRFWKKMEKLSEDENIEWLSTHPSHRTRHQHLDEFMPEAISILAHYCTRPDMDPRFPRSLPNNSQQIVIL